MIYVSSINQNQNANVEPESPSTTSNHDRELLESLGYQQEFRRDFGLWSTFCVSFTVLGLLPSFASTMNVGLAYAGTAGMIWGWLIAMVPIQCVAASMAELCSAMPTSGGLYYASAVLAPEGYGPIASWLTGWTNWVSQMTNSPSINYSLASMILALVTLLKPTYESKPWQIFLLTSLLTLLQSFISAMSTRTVARFNAYGSVFNVASLITVLVIILTKSERRDVETGVSLGRFSSTKKVWGEIHNGTEFPDGIAIMMSFVSVIWTMSGYDSAMHISEECTNADLASPRAIVMTSTVGGLIGWVLQAVVAYTIVDIEKVLDSPLGQPWASYLLQILPQNQAVFIVVLTIVCGFSMGQGSMMAASRVSYAYARDGCYGVWLSHLVQGVHPRTQTPVNAICFNALVGISLSLLILGGDTTISAIFSIGAISSFVGFAIPIALYAWCPRKSCLKRGRWHLGWMSRSIGTFGVLFVMIMIPFMCLPAHSGLNVNPALMNWTAIVYGGWMALISIWWLISARHWFEGPKCDRANKDNEVLEYSIEEL
ncbi:hypothetical protein CROQUDRAFT_673994 [Cronartium quercuum f. sp. fusiforme G11]|uniref:Amino acid transporter n=1 Tax=Cronartium quercuum f. sp. fusiforme G11 TaxID=708437 RepID=A0A9P6N9U8_9BASI|nr:hypothetical protein CROQUDRAFT_673994 [Cronartium quercuum f. sp. fusiforme G11]